MTSERYYDYYGGDYAVYRPAPARRRPKPVMHQAQAGYVPRRAAQGGYGGVRYGAERRPAPEGREPRRPANRSAASRRPGPADARRRPDANRRPPDRSRRRVRGIPLAVKLGTAVLALALLIFSGVKLMGNKGPTGDDNTFATNVFVNGVCLTGMTKDEGFELMHSRRDNWLNSVYHLTFQDRTWDFSPAMVNAKLELDSALEQAWSVGHMGDRASRRAVLQALEQTPAEFTTAPTYDEAAIDAFVAQIAQDVYVAPVDAEVTLTSEKPEITRASQSGWKLDESALKASLIGLIETGEIDTRLPVKEVQPMIASDEMEMNVIAKCETDVTFRGYPSRTNVRLALDHFNCLAVYPGDTVSFNDVVGPRTEALGYQEAPEYAGSTKEMGIGGGVCQASTTMYNAIIQAGMTIIERHRHTMTVSYVEPSLDAAVNYGKKDLVFRNDTEHAIYIYTNVSKKLATVTIYGTRPDYRYELVSNVLRESESDKIGYQDDVDGDYVYYTTDQPVLYRKGRGSCTSEGWIVSYDWDTGYEVNRVQISHDVYSAGLNVYWRGVHDPNGEKTATPPPSSF